MSPFQTEKPAYSEKDRKRYPSPDEAHNASQDAMKEIEKTLIEYGLGGLIALHADYGPEAHNSNGIVGVFCTQLDLYSTLVQIERSMPGTLEKAKRAAYSR